MQGNEQVRYLREKTCRAKERVLDMVCRAGMGHLSSAFSCAEILSVLYYRIMCVNPDTPDLAERDRLVISKNHASVMQYPILADLGFFPENELEAFLSPVLGQAHQFGSHAKNSLPGVDFSGGSLGIGLGVAAGIACAAQYDQKSFLTFCLLGDGECDEGSVWEAAMFAAHYRLGNLIAIVDRNRLAITGFTETMMALEPLADKWRAFGWEVRSCNGHDIGELLACLQDVHNRVNEKPLCVIANTVKGKGVEFIEDQLNWHGAAPKGEDIARAKASLEKERQRYECNT